MTFNSEIGVRITNGLECRTRQLPGQNERCAASLKVDIRCFYLGSLAGIRRVKNTKERTTEEQHGRTFGKRARRKVGEAQPGTTGINLFIHECSRVFHDRASTSRNDLEDCVR